MPQPGEIWFVDLGYVAKGRPVLVLYYPEPEDARSLVIVAPLTSQITGLPGEIDIGKPKFLTKRSAVNVQGLASFDKNKLERRMGILSASDFKNVKEEIRRLLDL